MLRLLNKVDPDGLREMIRKLEQDPLVAYAKRPVGAPKRWTAVRRLALYAFVERFTENACFDSFVTGHVIKFREAQGLRKQAMKAATVRDFPFREATLPAAKQQYSKAKTMLAGYFLNGSSLIPSHIASVLSEAAHLKFSTYENFCQEIGV